MLPTFSLLILIFIFNITNGQKLNETLMKINNFLGINFGWMYLLIALFAVVVCVYVFISPFGNTIIGGEGSKPMLAVWSWFCITLCTTVAAGIIFWGASEPIFHIQNPPGFLNIEPNSYAATIFSMSTMYLHWTITPYAIYCVPALMFAIALYNLKKPFSFSSCMSPVFKKANTPIFSATIDSICVFSVVMGMVASLGQGILSIAGGLAQISSIESNSVTWIVVGVLIIVAFTISACSGILKGIQWLSRINVYIFMFIIAGVFLVGPTSYMIGIGLESTGVYLDNFFTRSLMMGSGSNNDWSYFWTISTFANWMAWAPIIALFLGKISYGHSVRKFILINLVLPALCSGLWITIFGGTSIFIHLNHINLYEKIQVLGTESIIYIMLSYLPFGKYIVPILVFATFISFVTASDSTTNVLGELCCKDRSDKAPMLMSIKITWGIIIGAMALIIINSNGIGGIKMISAFGGFLSAFLVLFSGISLLKISKKEKI